MKEWTIVQWFYRRYICPKKGHNWVNWMCLGLPAQPYCKNCAETDPTWEGPGQEYFWRIKEA